MINDIELTELLRKNAEKGLKALTAQYGGLVYAVVRKYLANRDEIEACAAETFEDFYFDLEKIDPSKGSIKAWLCVAARHNAIDAARRCKTVLPLDEDIRADSGGRTMESDFEERELRRAVLSEVKALDEPDREILLRKYYLGEPSKSIAARLKMSVSNVDARTSRAVEKLRKKFDDRRS